jgi:hypothetical protein
MRQTSFFEFGILKVLRFRRSGATFYCKGSGRACADTGHRARVTCDVCGRRVGLTLHGRIPNHVEPDRLAKRSKVPA